MDKQSGFSGGKSKTPLQPTRGSRAVDGYNSVYQSLGNKDNANVDVTTVRTKVNHNHSSMMDAESREHAAVLSVEDEDDLVRVNPNELIKHVSNLNVHEQMLEQQQLLYKNHDLSQADVRGREIDPQMVAHNTLMKLQRHTLETQTNTLKSQLDNTNSLEVDGEFP